MIAGTFVLLARAVYGFDPLPLATLLLPASIALALAAWLASRRGLSAGAAATWVDVQAGGAGLVVTGQEIDDPRWGGAFAEALRSTGRMPAFRLGKPLGQSLGAGAFLAASLFVRIPEPAPGPSPAMFEAVLESLGRKLAALDENVALDEDVASDLTGRLARIRELLDDHSPESLFEAIDGLEERFGLEGDRIREAMESAAQDLAAAALDSLTDPKVARSSLERALEAMRQAGLDKNLPQSLAALLGPDLELPDGAELDPKRMLELSAELSKLMGERMEGLAGSGLLDPRKLSKLSEFLAAADLSEFLPTDHECDDECKEGG